MTNANIFSSSIQSISIWLSQLALKTIINNFHFMIKPTTILKTQMLQQFLKANRIIKMYTNIISNLRMMWMLIKYLTSLNLCQSIKMYFVIPQPLKIKCKAIMSHHQRMQLDTTNSVNQSLLCKRYATLVQKWHNSNKIWLKFRDNYLLSKTKSL